MMGTGKTDVGKILFINGEGNALFRSLFVINRTECFPIAMSQEGAFEKEITAFTALDAFTMAMHYLLHHIIVIEITDIKTSQFSSELMEHFLM